MKRSRRDEFNEGTKRLLAGRVGWRCAFKGCGVLTVGPQMGKPGVLITGKAAHITAAASGGPRFEPALTPAQRKAPANGMWVCATHADVIDKDELNYSVETLLQWRTLAEQAAYMDVTLPQPQRQQVQPPTTLVALGFGLVFEGIWTAGAAERWVFEIRKWVQGDQTELQHFVESARELDPKRHFIAVESQGDGRVLTAPPSWAQVDQGKSRALLLTLPVHPRPARRDPATIGSDLALVDGDLVLKDGDLALVSGVENAKQHLRNLLHTPIGGLVYAPEYGVRWRELALRWASDLTLLGRLFRLDLARVISAPVSLTESDFDASRSIAVLKPQIDFVERIQDVNVLNLDLDQMKVRVRLQVIWSNGEPWEGEMTVHLSPPKEPPTPPALPQPPAFLAKRSTE